MARLTVSLAILACLGFIAIQGIRGESDSENLDVADSENLQVADSYEGLQREVEEPQFRKLREAKKCRGKKCNRSNKKKTRNLRCKCKNGQKSKKCCRNVRSGKVSNKKKCECKNGKIKIKCCKKGRSIQSKGRKKCPCKNGERKAKCCRNRRNNPSKGRKAKSSKGKKPQENHENKPVKGGRQACDEAKLCTKIKDFIKYSNQLRKIKRITKKCKLMETKKTKAATEFQNASDALVGIDDALAEELKNCSTSAAAGCEKTGSTGCKIDASLKECKTALEDFLKKFGPDAGSCLKASDNCCACITAIPEVKADCLSFDAHNNDAVEKAKSCTSGGKKGSFGHCKKLLSKGALSCKGGAKTTTAGVSSTAKKAMRRKFLQQWLKN